MIETNNKRILIDPGVFGYSEEILNNQWVNIDYILVTHKHADHCNKEAIENIDEEKMLTYLIENKYYDELEEIYAICFNIGEKLKEYIKKIINKGIKKENFNEYTYIL